MVGAGVNFFKFSAPIGVILERFKSFQILKLVGSYFRMFKYADLKATEKSFEYYLKLGGNFTSGENPLQVSCRVMKVIGSFIDFTCVT